MPAKKTAKRATKPAKRETKSPSFKERGYTQCETCSRWMSDLTSHTKDHKSGKIGKDGKRTDRSKVEALAFRNRFNGTEATKRFEDKTPEERAKMKITA